MSELQPDVVPAVSVAVEFGQHVKSFDVDLPALTEYLRERGVPDAEIEGLQINFPHADQPTDQRGMMQAVYDRSSDTIDMYSFEEVRMASRTAHPGFDYLVENKLNGSLRHELEHKIATGKPKLRRASINYRRRTRIVNELKRVGVLGAGYFAGRTAPTQRSSATAPDRRRRQTSGHAGRDCAGSRRSRSCEQKEFI